MFFSQFVLSKKGPLAKIWLAAHWEKKLSKQQIFDTNVEDACDEVIKPRVKMALRTTGHLLLGIVRIYSRKAKYLLADCNEAFLKIKMAFRPGQVDLGDDEREANANAITLPEVFHDFDTALPDFNDLDVQQSMSLTQSRIEDITLKEEVPNKSRYLLDNFGDGGAFGDEDLMEIGRAGGGRQSALGAGSFNRPPSALSAIGGGGPASVLAAGTPDATPMAVADFLPPTTGGGADDFGGQFDEKMFVDNIFDEDALREVETMDVDERPPTAAPSEPGGPTLAAQQQGKEAGAQENSSFQLEPIDGAAVPHERPKGRPPLHRRKMLVDDTKNISGDEMKAQMRDYADTLAPLDLAPPTRRLMQLKDAGVADRLFGAPGAAELLAEAGLAKMHAARVASLRCRPDALELCAAVAVSAGGSGGGAESSGASAAVAAVPTIIEEMELARVDQLLMHDRADGVESAESLLEPPGAHDDILDEMQASPAAAADGQPAASPPLSPGAAAADGKDKPQQQHERSAREKKDKHRQSKADKTADDSAALEDTSGPKEGETAGDAEERRWTKRTHHILANMQHRLQEAGGGSDAEIAFADLCKGATRKSAASKFYTLLVLKKWQAVGVRQEAPLAEIHVRAGPKMADKLAA